MKKLSLLVMPLMAISLLASCGGNTPAPEEDVKFSADTTVTLDETKKIANITLDWTPTEHSVECSDFTFTLTNQPDIKSEITSGELGSRPLNLTITFNKALDTEDKGDLTFHYTDKTAKKEGEGKIAGINVKLPIDPPGPTKYTLSTTCINGSFSYHKPEYEKDEDVTLYIDANEGHWLPPSVDDFDEIKGINKSAITYTATSSLSATLTFKMPANEVTITLTAIEPTPTARLLTARCMNGTVKGNKIAYEPNEGVALTFIADEGYLLPTSIDDIAFTGINKSAVTYDNTTGSLTFTMPNNSVSVTVTAQKVWYLDDEYINSLDEDDIGTTQTLKVNGIDQNVRLIGVDHDNLALSSGKAHTTWEFVDLLSDQDGYSLATVWDWKNGDSTTNQDYLNSNLRKALDGSGNGELVWYRKGQATSEQSQQTEYANKTVLDMLPTKLQEVIKEVKKPVATTASYTVNDTYDTKVFPLSYSEMTGTVASGAENEGKTYAFYKGDGDTDTNRIKHQFKWHDQAVTSSTPIADGKCAADNFAGFNSSSKEENGGQAWLRSPYVTNEEIAWYANTDGQLIAGNFSGVNSIAYAVAPAFCLGEREWYQNQDYINSLTENDVGTTTQTLNVNGVDHLVRLIGVEHDDLSDNSGKAHTTWEFENLLSDHDGYSLATIWDWGKGKDTNNQDYLDSTLRKTFDGSGNGDIVWYRKGQATSEQTQQTEYANKTVLDMLPADLKEVIKEVKKPIATGSSYTVDTYNAKVFPLSCHEVVKGTPEFSEAEGSTYTFYKNDGSVKKRQVKGNDGAATDFTEITDGKLGVKANNWAGFNSPASDEGGHFWLRSPSVRFETPEHETADNYAWWVRRDGYVSITDNLIYNRVFAVAPAFCI